jgi:hypothetical protein
MPVILPQDATSDPVTATGKPVLKPWNRTLPPFEIPSLTPEVTDIIKTEVEDLRKYEHELIFVPTRIRTWNPCVSYLYFLTRRSRLPPQALHHNRWTSGE